MDECCTYPSPKGDLGITKNYRGTAIIAFAANLYNVLLLNPIKYESRNLLGKIRTAFGEIDR